MSKYAWLIVLVGLLLGCSGAKTPTPPLSPLSPLSPLTEVSPLSVEQGGVTMAFTMTSTAFAPGAAIPARYTCKGDDLSPPLAWTAPPAATQSLALISDDPDAPGGNWDHWILYNIPAATRALPEGYARKNAPATLPDGALHGKNGWGRRDYGGPCPPSGTHRYFFKLYALDVSLALEAGATKKQLLAAMEGHILAQTELMGVCSR